MIKTGNTIEEACFTGAVGTDHRHQFAGMNIKINILDGNNAAETQT